jgi:mRNA interferase HigB
VQVRIVTAGRIHEWSKSHSVISSQLLQWLGRMQNLDACNSFNDLRQADNTVDQVKTEKGKNVCVFNLGHGKNAYRLIAAIHFNTQVVFVLRLLTHAEYDKEDWKAEL